MFLGDILFTTSVAECLHRQHGIETEVDYCICLPQPKFLLEANPFIREVYTSRYEVDESKYDKVYKMPLIHQSLPATIQHQIAAEITNENMQLGYHVYTVAEHDEWAKDKIMQIRVENPQLPILGVQLNWKERSYQSTQDALNKGEDRPFRDIESIVAELTKFTIIVPLGFPVGKNSSNIELQDPNLYSKTASIIKQCDFVVGSEGGMTNLSAGIGTPTIITTDFIYQNYSITGRVAKNENPQMGPLAYFPNRADIFFHLAPTIIDEQIPELIKSIITQKEIGMEQSNRSTNLKDYEWRWWSQHGEDGIIKEIFNVIKPKHKQFVEIGAHFHEANCLRLSQHDNWKGFYFDDFHHFPSLGFHKQWVSAGNINQIFNAVFDAGMQFDFDILSLDIDGVDWYLWNALDDKWTPALVIVECNEQLGITEDKVMQYDENFRWDGSVYYGASIQAWVALAKKKGYTLLYIEDSGNNMFFIRNDLSTNFEIKTPQELWEQLHLTNEYIPDTQNRTFISSEEAMKARAV